MTDKQLRAIRFYIGDVSGRDPFWGDPKAYLVLNSLLYSGVSTECARASEGKRLNPHILDDTGRLLEVYGELFSAFRECRAERDMVTFRVERWSDFLISRKAGRTVSLTSTSTAGFLSDYRDRKGIALMKFRIKKGSPCLDMARVLPEYAKSQEAEVLLPPGMRLEFQEMPLSPEELLITDCDGAPPVGCFEISCGEVCLPALDGKELPQEGADAGKRLYSAICGGGKPSPEDAAAYSDWKKALHRVLGLGEE